MAEIILLLFLEGSGYPDESSLTTEDRKFLDDAYALHEAAVPGMLDRWRRGMSMLPTTKRILGFLNGIYHYALITHGDDDELYEWEYGDTIDHCADCSGSVAAGPKPISYWKAQATAGIYPGSPALECTGLNCLCTLKKVSNAV